MVGLIVPDIANPFFAGVSRGAQDVAREKGYFVVVCNTDGDFEQEIALIQSLYEHRMEGMIVAPAGASQNNLQFLLEHGVPVVLFGREEIAEETIVDCVGIDDTVAAYDAVNHLISEGHTSIALITGPLNRGQRSHRLEGYRRALVERGIPYRDELVVNGNYLQDSGYRSAAELLTRGARFSAVFATNDLMAIGAMMAFQEKGLRIPEDVAVIGFDNIAESRVTTPRLSTIDNPNYMQGKVSAEMLFERIGEQRRVAPRAAILAHRLVVRGSTKCGIDQA
jgi:LacI family transcriptional regulator